MALYYGGVFHARSVGPGLDTDRAVVTSQGFTILGEDDLAGFTKIFVYGLVDSVLEATNNNVFMNLPSWFYQHGKTAPTLQEVRAWPVNGEEDVIRA